MIIRIIHWLLIGCALMSSAAFAQFEFGVITGQNCQSSSCEIRFTKSYSEPPVVFLMSSIKQNNLANDNPALAVVESVTTTQAQIRQDNVFSGTNLTMDPIYYFVAEPGVWAPDPSQPTMRVEVGKLNASRYQRQGNRTGESWHTRTFSTSFNGQTPIVFSQIQPNAGRTFWVNSTVDNVSSTSFRYALEFGRQPLPNSNIRTRTFGYLAAPPFSGVTAEGIDFSFVLPSRQYNQGNGTNGLRASCNNNRADLPRSYTNYGIVAKKQTRNGGDGGWLRACDLSADDHFTFTLEEDATNRSHPVSESIGYFVYGSPTVDLCEYFPSSAQNNYYVNGFPASGLFSLSGNNSEVYLPDRSPLSFTSVSLSGRNSGCIYDGSTLERCIFDASVTYPDFPPTLPPFQSGTATINCNSNNCSASPGTYQSLLINNNRRLTLSAGVYWVDTLNFANGADLVTNGQVFIHYRRLNVNGNSVDLNWTGDYEDLVLIGHGSISQIQAVRQNLRMKALLYIESADGFTYSGNDLNFEGSISSQTVRTNNNNIRMDLKPPRQCSAPTNDYQVSVTPPTDIGLMCGTDFPQFSVTTTNNGSPISTEVNIQLYRASFGDASFLQASVEGGVGSGSGSQFTTNANGQLNLAISSTDPSATLLNTSYRLRVEMALDSTKTQTTTYKFVPFKFSIDDVDAVAGKAQSVSSQVLACDENNNPVVAQSYTGTPTVTHAIVTPALAQGGINGNLTFSPQFSASDNGRTTDDLTINESGVFTVTLTDDRFDCTGLSGCPIEGNAELTGRFTLNVRPWKIALCDIHQSSNIGNTNPATTTGSPGFLNSGLDFDVTYRPVVFSGTSSDECALAITQNYAKDSGPLNVAYTLLYPSGGRLGSPAPATVSGFEPTSSTKEVVHSWDEVGTLQFATSATYLGMALDQDMQAIGRFYPAHFAMQSITQQWRYASGHNGFAYMNQPIGHAFTVEAQNVSDNPTSNYGLFSDALISDFTYLARQNDGTSLNGRVIATTNWNGGVWGDRSYWQLAKNGSVDTAKLELEFNDFSFEKQTITHSSGNYTTQPDGPYTPSNSEFGLEISDAVDGVQFKEVLGGVDTFVNEVTFPLQPVFRYGRMHLTGGGTITGQSGLAIPLRMEYWDQTRFIINVDDNGSQFDSDDFCRQVIWRSDGAAISGASLTGSGSVGTGLSRDLAVNHNNSTVDLREQVRVWLRVNSTPPSALPAEEVIQCNSDGIIDDQSWLRFNWRNNGDEDPPAVITFGIFRGNDRVIFRGEPGLFGQ
ncbi:DUF6701 domain-containing protein [Vibrio sp. NH-7]